MSVVRRVIAAAAICAVPLVASAPFAHAGGGAGETTLTHGTGSWLEVGTVPGLLAGNIHRGGVSFLDDADPTREDYRSGRIEDWTCPTGVVPPALYAIEDPETFPGTACTLEGVLELDLSSTSVSVDERLSMARISGSAVVRQTGGAVVTTIPIDIALEADGAPRRHTDVYRFQDDSGTWITDRTVITSRSAVMAGSLGTIGIADEPDDVTEATLGRQETTIR